MANVNETPNGVVLISTEICTPYREGEMATFDPETANLLLTRDKETNPVVKWRRASREEIATYLETRPQDVSKENSNG